jgi:hypothetical protein
MRITPNDLAGKSGTALADEFLEDIKQSVINDDEALYKLIDGLTHRKSSIDNAVLKALLDRMQKQLEARHNDVTCTQTNDSFATVDAVGTHEPSTFAPKVTYKPFSWFNNKLMGDQGAQFVALTMDICQGIQTCLELIHSNTIERTHNPLDSSPFFDVSTTERLLRFTKVAARLLANEAEERIECLNEAEIKDGK